ncbi:hypothetical protein L323_18355 [Ruminiclostridium papyrosolvens C7]|uniref:Uncharacterized protein n=1 Tax=Ruminiclostridium papyrosolvens C7 TaxID=1330534 RepID=U4QYF3_9FIRM|nr:hypothetical protein L323_18355 [Ruminiclostridium papyrosolvens C7]
MHKLKKLLGKILIGTMLLTLTGTTSLVINAADTTNPYIKLY